MQESKLVEEREQIQHDIDCLLDGMDEELRDKVCQVIVDHFEVLILENRKD